MPEVPADQDAARGLFKAQIEERIEVKRRAYQIHDAQLIASEVYTPDAIITGPGDVHLSRRDEFLPVFKEYLQQRSDLSLDIVHYDVSLDGTLGYTLGNLTTYPAGDGSINHVKMLAIWRKSDQGWRMAVEVYFPGVIVRK